MLCILFQRSMVCHLVHGNILHMLVVLCSLWESFPDLFFVFGGLCYAGWHAWSARNRFLSINLCCKWLYWGCSDEFAIQNVSQNTGNMDVYFCIWTDHLTPGFCGLLGQVSTSLELDSDKKRNSGQPLHFLTQIFSVKWDWRVDGNNHEIVVISTCS